MIFWYLLGMLLSWTVTAPFVYFASKFEEDFTNRDGTIIILAGVVASVIPVVNLAAPIVASCLVGWILLEESDWADKPFRAPKKTIDEKA